MAASGCWDAIMKRDLNGFAKYFMDSFEAQIALFPGMMQNDVQSYIDKYSKNALAWKMPGAGGGGYLLLVCEEPLDGSIRVKIRRNCE